MKKEVILRVEDSSYNQFMGIIHQYEQVEVVSEKEYRSKAERRGRPKLSDLPVKKTFVYDQEESSVRLMMLCKGLKALGWLDQDTDLQTFIDLFSGKEINKRIIWKSSAGTLAELFRRLVNEHRLVTLPAQQSLWVTVNAHFWEKKSGQRFGCDKLRKSNITHCQDQTIGFLVCILDPDYEIEELRNLLKLRR